MRASAEFASVALSAGSSFPAERACWFFAYALLLTCFLAISAVAQVSFYHTPFNSVAAQVVFESDLTLHDGKPDVAAILGFGLGTASFISTTSTFVFAAADLTGNGNTDLLTGGTVFL